jgi:hypothetical protein
MVGKKYLESEQGEAYPLRIGDALNKHIAHQTLKKWLPTQLAARLNPAHEPVISTLASGNWNTNNYTPTIASVQFIVHVIRLLIHQRQQIALDWQVLWFGVTWIHIT